MGDQTILLPPPRTSTTYARVAAGFWMDLQDNTGQIGMTALRVVGRSSIRSFFKTGSGPAPNLLYGTKQRNQDGRRRWRGTWQLTRQQSHSVACKKIRPCTLW